MDYVNLTDQELILLYTRESNREAFGVLYDRYAVQVYRFIYSMCGNKEISEDVTSETFFTLLSEIQHYNGSSKLFTYMASIAKYKLYHVFSHEKKLNRSYIDEECELFEIENEDDIIIPDGDFMQKLDVVMANLHESYKTVLEYRYLRNMTTKEIAAVMQKSEVNIRVLLHRAIAAAAELAQNINFESLT